MKARLFCALLFAMSPAMVAQSFSSKQMISWELFFGYEDVFDKYDFYGTGERKSGSFGIVGGWGFRLNHDWYMRFELGYGTTNEYSQKRVETLSGSDLYDMKVKANTLILGGVFTRFIPISASKFYLSADLGGSLYLSKLNGEADPYRLGVATEKSNGTRFQTELGIYPGFAFRPSEDFMIGINYGFIGLRTMSTDLSFSNYQLTNSTVFSALLTDFSASSIRLRFTYFFK